LNRLLAVSRNTFRECIRERVLYNLVIFAILMILSGLFLGQLSIRQDEKILKDIGLASMDFFGTLIAVFVGVGLVGKEIERRSLYPLLAKPLSRDEFFLGRFLGLLLVLLVNLVMMAGGLFLTLAVTWRKVDPRLLLGLYTIFLGLVLTVALALFFSTLTSSTLATVCTVGLVIAGRSADVVRHMKDVLPWAPGWLAQFLYYLLPNFHDLDFKDAIAYGDPLPSAQLLRVTAYVAVYTLVLLGAGLNAFRTREFY